MFFMAVFLSTQGCKKDDPDPGQQWPEGKIPMGDFHGWSLSSTPSSFVESGISDDLAYGMNRAKLCWYNIDPIFSKAHPQLPPNITVDELSKPYVREVLLNEIYPDEESPNGVPEKIMTLNLDFYPSLRGPYNYDAYPTLYSSGMDPQGNLAEPGTRWGGIMRALPVVDHPVKYIEFWLMDPFIENENIEGELFINLGRFNEDILRDGLPANEASLSDDHALLDSTDWGYCGSIDKWKTDFVSAQNQDLGLDGLDNEGEIQYFGKFLQDVFDLYGQSTAVKIMKDPSADDYHYYRGTDYDNWTPTRQIKMRYSLVNGLEGNSKPDELNPEDYPVAITHLPDSEDLDGSNSLNFTDSYGEYRIPVKKEEFVLNRNYIAGKRDARGIPLPNGDITESTWYYFRIPVGDYTGTYGNPVFYWSFPMIRIYLAGFDEQVTLRFADFYLSEN